ncbi:hypothetical protein BJ944DRAFT_248152 [Cunninghamella echinulata]|nr:hypothetical protein BJ944DRAFT_248152 [Cunninghamella echinulata]
MSSSLRIAVIGGGFSGIAAAVQVEKQLGLKATIFEACHDFGGTWMVNTYWGCGCDVPSHLYSLSFEKNPNWSERYSKQPEIYDYMKGVAKKYKLYDQAHLNTEVIEANWKEENKEWELKVHHKETGETRIVYFDVVFAGLGPLRIPNIPEEFKNFEGPLVHTAFWDKSIDYTNKKVGMIGSGASAVQVIPQLQPIVSSLTSYQRSPTWCIARKQYYYSSFTKSLFNWFPFLMLIHRFFIFITNEIFFYLGFRYHNSYLGKKVHASFKKQMKQRLIDNGRPDLVDKLTPDYEAGCRRITPSETYLESLCKENIMVERSRIESVKGRTIRTVDGNETEFDILILATGYNTTGFLGNLQVNGRDSVNLNKLWEENYTDTYKTIAIHGFPNFFMLLGPGSGLGHNSVVTMAEIQVNNAIKCIRQLKDGVKAIEPTEKAQAKFVKELKDGLSKTVWTTGCESWYKNKNGEVFALYAGSVTSFWWKLRNNNFDTDFIKY